MLNLTKEEHILLELIRHGLSGQDITVQDNDINWDEVIAEAAVQAVTILACDSAACVKDTIPDETFKKWKNISLKGMMNNLKVQKAQKDMVSFMEDEGYPYVILKGLSAACYYPKPQLRILGDVDFLIDPEKKSELAELFVKKGYSQHLDNHDCHIVLKKTGSHLEMHFEPSGIPNGSKGEYIRDIFKNAAYNGIEATVDNDTFCVPHPFIHGMILALHMQHHQVSEGLGLRHLCDWACFVDRTADEDFWDNLIAEFKTIGLFRYISLMTKACSIYLGTKLPEWAENADDQVCAEIINDIFAVGNFGRKNEIRSKSGMMVSNHGKDGTKHNKLFYLYNTLHKSSAINKPGIETSRILWFAEDCRRAGLYIIRMFRGERASFAKMLPEAEKRKKLYTEFHLFETDKP